MGTTIGEGLIDNLKVNYLVTWYVGKRRVVTASDPRFFIRRHLDFLQDNNIAIDRVTVILNRDTEEEEALARKVLVDEYSDYYTDLVFLVRENKGFSYAAWDYAMNKCIREGEHFDLYWLLEDDYAPGVTDFTEQYFTKIENNVSVGYVCQRLSDEVLSSVFNTQVHPGICCGLLAGDAAEEAYRVYGSVLRTFSTNRYDMESLHAQIHFMDNVTDLGYTYDDSGDFSSVVFVHHAPMSERGWKLVDYGDPDKPRVIEPVINWSEFQPTVEVDVV